MPVGVYAVNCDTQAIPQLSMTTSATVNGVLTPAPVGYFWLTAQYPFSEQFQWVEAAGGQVVANATNVAVTFAASPTKTIGTNISYNGSSTFTVLKAGMYDVRAGLVWPVNAVGYRFVAVMLNGARNFSTEAAPNNDQVIQNLSKLIYCNAGDVWGLQCNQNSGGNLSLGTGTGDTTFLQVRQLSNDASLTANVTLYVVGG